MLILNILFFLALIQGGNSFSGAYALLIITDDEDDNGSGESMSSCNCKCLYFVGDLKIK